MPVQDPRTGNIFVWLVSSVFFVAILSGGAFLLTYITLPETENTAWFAIGGVVLVSMPWFFWLLTFLYRLIAHGARIGGGGGGGGSRGRGGEGESIERGEAANSVPSTADIHVPSAIPEAESADSPVETPRSRERRVRFGTAVVVGGSSSQGKDAENHRSSSISNDDDDVSSFASRDSETPLRLSMASSFDQRSGL